MILKSKKVTEVLIFNRTYLQHWILSHLYTLQQALLSQQTSRTRTQIPYILSAKVIIKAVTMMMITMTIDMIESAQCHVMNSVTFYIMSYCIVLCHIVLYYVILYCIISYYSMLCCVVVCDVMLYHFIYHYVISCYITCVISTCSFMLHYVTLCYIMLHQITSHNTTIPYLTFSS